jgi:hypothetical protein
VKVFGGDEKLTAALLDRSSRPESVAFGNGVQVE